MKNTSKTVPALILGAGGLALIVALVLTFIPWNTNGTAEATAASRAQQSLDDVAFKLAEGSGARYSGTLTYRYKNEPAQEVSFKDMLVTATSNVEGTLTVEGKDARYRQIAGLSFANGSTDFWNALLTEDQKEALDLKPVNNTWAATRYSGLPLIGAVLNPRLVAGRMANAELAKAPALGAELPGQNKGTPDARYWSTSDPSITPLGDGKVRAGQWEITYDPDSKNVSHVQGEYTRGSMTYTINADVTPVGADELTPVFGNERSMAREIASVPAPGLFASDISARAERCAPGMCEFTVTFSGKSVADESRAPDGYVNYSPTLEFFADRRQADNNQPMRGISVTCPPVVRVDFGKPTSARCVARFARIPPPDMVFSPAPLQYLAFVDNSPSDVDSLINDTEKSTKNPVTLARTGLKRPDAAKYTAQQTGLPSSYVVKKGGYLFDGVDADGAYVVAFAPGYDQHVSTVSFDESWPGTALLKKQMAQQAKAVGDGKVVYYVADEKTALALRFLTFTEGLRDKITVYQEKME